MANEKFRVKFGLAVGDNTTQTAMTVDGATGDIYTDGDITANQNLQVNGSTTLGNAPADTVAINGDTQINNALTIGSSSGDTVTVNSQVTGEITFTDNSTTTNRGITGLVGANDYWRFGGGATGANSGYAEIATGDDGTEPIYVRQYNTGPGIIKTTTIMDASGNTQLYGDLTINGNGYIYSNTGLALDLTGADVEVLGDLTVSGNDIKKSSGTTVLTFSGTNLITTAGDIVIGGNTIRSNGGTAAIELSADDVTVEGDLTLNGNVIRSSTNQAIQLTGADVIVSGDITVTGNEIKSSTGTAITLSGTSATVAGDLAVNGGDITTTQTTGTVFNTTATAVNIAGAATTVSIGANTGTTTINNSLVADDISIATVDATNIEVSNIKAKDGTAAITIADTTGAVNVTTSLTVDNIDIRDNTISSTDTDGNIVLLPNGTGDVILSSDTVQIGDANSTATLTTNLASNLVLNTNNGTNSGNITITQGVNGAITLAPNGTGNIALNTNDGGNVVCSRNFVDGAIRNASTQARGNIWELLSTTGTGQFTGFSVDNSTVEATKSASMVIRNYGAAATARGRLIFERSRGTAASPSAILAGDFLGEVDATGYTTAGWINDLVAAVPGFYGFAASENWTSIDNCGAALTVSLQPTATTLAAGSQVNVLGLSPQANIMRSDVLGMSQGKTTGFVATGCSISGTTLTIGTVTSGTVAIGQMIINAAQTISQSAYIVSGSGSTWTLNFAPGNITNQTVTGRVGFISSVAGYTAIINPLRLAQNVINNSSNLPQVTLSADRSTLLLVGDTVTVDTVSGTDLLVLNPGNTRISSNIITLEDSAGADYLVLNSTSATFTKPVGFPVYTAAAAGAITGAVGQQISISDSPTAGGRMAFWDTTNSRWSYISDNSAV